MSYRITIRRRAQKQLDRIHPPHFDRIKQAIAALADDPRPRGSLRLKGRDGWRIRIGDFRVVYEVFDQQRQVDVLDVDNRRDVYR